MTLIRPATAGDAAQIGLVHVRSWQAAHRGLVPQDYLDHLDSAARAARFYTAAGWSEDGATLEDASLGFPLAEVRCHRTLP